MRITDAKALPGYRLELRFEGGEAGIADLSWLVGQGVFSAWEDPVVFKAVKVTPEGAVEWPGDIDLCPDTLYLRMTGKTPEDVFPNLSQQHTHA